MAPTTKTYSPDLDNHASTVAEQMGIPEEHARKAVGSLQLSTFKACVDRQLDYTPDFIQRKVAIKQQDKEIQRQVAEAEHTADREHADMLALMDLDFNATMTADDRLVLGKQTKQDLRDDAATTDAKAELKQLKQQLKDAKQELEQQTSGTNGKGKTPTKSTKKTKRKGKTNSKTNSKQTALSC